MQPESVVYLLPGFLGVDRVGAFYYFADRVSATLRGSLQCQLGRDVPVIPMATGPTEGLIARQRKFMSDLVRLDAVMEQPEQVHLFGHSTGGLDAELLLYEKKLDGRIWSADEQSVRRRIASVTTVAAPFFGTTLALTDVARLLHQPLRNLGRAGSLLAPLLALSQVRQERSALSYQLLGDVGAAGAFVRQLARDRDLFADLAPEHVEGLRAGKKRELTHVKLTCFVTCAMPNPSPVTARLDGPDALFLYLVNHTAGARVTPSAAVLDNIRRLDACQDVICSPSLTTRPRHAFDPVDNDAVVNSCRQLVPDAELGGIVHADHADVLGHYDRRDPLHPERIINEGVFRSGARFGDNEFFDLYGRVAKLIANAELTPKRDRSLRQAAPLVREAPP
jgi:hypothetical protein